MSTITTNKPNFEMLAVSGDFVSFVEKVWTCKWWDMPSLRRLTRKVPAGWAEIIECLGTGGNFILKITVQPVISGRSVEITLFFDDVEAAAEAAEVFAWETKEHAGVRWYQTTGRDDYKVWQAVLSENDVARLCCGEDGEYHMVRNISLRSGESYEMSATRYDSHDGKHAVRTFAEAAAIAITLPSFLAVLGARQ